MPSTDRPQELVHLSSSGQLLCGDPAGVRLLDVAVRDGIAELDASTPSDPRAALTRHALERMSRGSSGTFAVVADHGGVTELRLDEHDGGWVVSARRRFPAAPSAGLVDGLRRGAGASLQHARRSPLVRLESSVVLAGRASGSGLRDELARLDRALRDQLERAGDEVDGVLRLAYAADAPARALPADGFRDAVSAARGTPAPRGPGWAMELDDGMPSTHATVVVPWPNRRLVDPVARLLEHLGEHWPSQTVRVLVPGDGWSAGPTTDAGIAATVAPGDREHELRIARGWPQGPEGAVGALRDAALLRAGGVEVAFHDGRGAWAQLALAEAGVLAVPTEGLDLVAGHVRPAGVEAVLEVAT